MMRHQGRRDELIDPAAAHGRGGKLPEYSAVIAAHADAPDDLCQNDRAAPQVAPIEPGAAYGRGAAIWIGVLQVPPEAGINRLRRVGMTDRALPARQHLGVGQSEDDI
jgi:hypothetical protein